MSADDVDGRAFAPRIAVVGGGLSGLSLALHLQAMPAFRGRVTLYETRAVYADDRRWSFWALGAHPFEALPMRRFTRLRVAAGGRSVSFDCAATPYVCLAAGDVYAHAVAALADDPRFALRMGSTVRAIEQDADGVRVLLAAEDDGQVDSGPLDDEHADDAHLDGERGNGSGDTHARPYDLVFDARPPRIVPDFLQWFVGAEVALDAGSAMPEPVLMDFDLEGLRADPGCVESQRPRNGDTAAEIVFAYVLPQAEDRLLVQLTWFLPRGVAPPDDAWARWRRYVSERLGLDPTRMLREECGAIPMHPARPAADPRSRVQPIGGAAGWIRAATGYGFLDTQRAAARLARALAHDHLAHDHADARAHAGAAPARRCARVRARSRIDDAMDAILLDAMRRTPEAAAGWFLRLFQRCPPPRLIRFLSAEASVVDRLAVMAALPPGPFLAAAWRLGVSR